MFQVLAGIIRLESRIFCFWGNVMENKERNNKKQFDQLLQKLADALEKKLAILNYTNKSSN